MKQALTWLSVGGVALVFSAGAALAQDAAPPPPENAPAPKAEPPQPDAGLPGLDDLLGIPKPAEERAPDAADALKRELEDKLAGRQIAEQFGEAVRLMGQTAERLQTAGDVGLATQRLQEDVLKKLDAMIESAKKKEGDPSSSSSSQSDSDKRRNQPNQPQGQQNQAGKGDNRGQVDPPGRREGPVNPALDQTGAAWGGLPAHVREALSQGYSDSYSAIYRAMTEEYYRRLAEEAGK